MARSVKTSSAAMKELRAYGLTFPETHTKTPWPGHLDLAVKGKTFAFMSTDGEPFSLTCKLPNSGVAALVFPFAKPAEYGLGKSGWVNARFEPGITPPSDVLHVFKDWILESYLATAPKRLAATLRLTPSVAPSGKAPRTTKAAAKPAHAALPKKKRAAAKKSAAKAVSKKKKKAR